MGVMYLIVVGASLPREVSISYFLAHDNMRFQVYGHSQSLSYLCFVFFSYLDSVRGTVQLIRLNSQAPSSQNG